jgi:hypothetical protein
MYGGDLDHMTPKAYWERPTWELPGPYTPIPHGDDGTPLVDPYDPLVV